MNAREGKKTEKNTNGETTLHNTVCDLATNTLIFLKELLKCYASLLESFALFIGACLSNAFVSLALLTYH